MRLSKIAVLTMNKGTFKLAIYLFSDASDVTVTTYQKAQTSLQELNLRDGTQLTHMLGKLGVLSWRHHSHHCLFSSRSSSRQLSSPL